MAIHRNLSSEISDKKKIQEAPSNEQRPEPCLSIRLAFTKAISSNAVATKLLDILCSRLGSMFIFLAGA